MSRGYRVRGNRYVGGTGTSNVSLIGMMFSMLLGIGLAGLLTFALLFSDWPVRWVMAVMTVALLVGIGMWWVCIRLDWPFLDFFKMFSCMMLTFWNIILHLEVTEQVVLWNTWHLTAIGAILGIWVAVKRFRWEKKYRDMSRASVSLAVIIGFFCFLLCRSTLLGINILADVRAARQTTVQVIRVESERRTTYGRTAHSYTVYFAVVEENDLTEAGRFPVDKTLYDSLEPGDQVLLTLHSGALGAPWVECSSEEK